MPCGPGVERLQQSAAVFRGKAGGTVNDHVTSHAALAALMEDVTSGAIDILIGTQMVAKGHDFRELTLVGVVDVDLGLAVIAGGRAYLANAGSGGRTCRTC